jgi:hypothetical protein
LGGKLGMGRLTSWGPISSGPYTMAEKVSGKTVGGTFIVINASSSVV